MAPFRARGDLPRRAGLWSLPLDDFDEEEAEEDEGEAAGAGR